VTAENATFGKKDSAGTEQKMSSARLAGWVLFFGVWGAVLLVVITLELSGAVAAGLILRDLVWMNYVAAKRLKHALAASAVLIVGIVVFLSGVFVQRLLQTANAMVCGSNVSDISHALLLYAEKNDSKYPATEKWCDLLIEDGFITAKSLRCPAPWTGRCHYALNPNCWLKSSPDTILLFETESGWNQSGGPESLTFDNHGGKGANVLFNDGHVEFVKPEDAGKLKWAAGDANKIE
jgi:prepilin-type processing-associated H-X9-DG protein